VREAVGLEGSTKKDTSQTFGSTLRALFRRNENPFVRF
jgi:hypothetical protein